MVNEDILADAGTLTAQESSLLQSIGNLAKILGAIGLGFTVLRALTSFYSIFRVTENSEMWTYYKTTHGFSMILGMILSISIFAFISIQLINFGQQLKQATSLNKQEYFNSAWRHFNRALGWISAYIFVIVILINLLRVLLSKI
jgi:hypothetical protein